MSYELFCSEIDSLCERYGLQVWYKNHDERGHFALLSNGLRISANSIATSVKIWTRNHSAHATWDQLERALCM